MVDAIVTVPLPPPVASIIDLATIPPIVVYVFGLSPGLIRFV